MNEPTRVHGSGLGDRLAHHQLAPSGNRSQARHRVGDVSDDGEIERTLLPHHAHVGHPRVHPDAGGE